VRRGDTLAVVSSPEFGAAQSEARRADTDFALAERALNRSRELQGAGVIPMKELLAAEADFERARAERDRTVARQKLYGGSRTIDQQYALVAPIAGVVVERHVTVGQEVRPDAGADTPALFVISDPYNLWLNLDVPEALTQEVQLGEAVRVSVPALPNVVFPAQVDFIADFIDPQSRTVKARASIANPNRNLKAEMFITAEVEIPPSTALKVPATALFLVDRDYHCFVEDSVGKFTRRKVRAEEAAIGFMRVKEGLRSGDKVVADGALLLQRMLTQKAVSPEVATAVRAGK
jgi:membrane fusion protein, heavy metal efflux system